MATYYVRTDGSDTNAGTGSGTGSAWKTIGKALGSTGIASGDTVWIAPGKYRETVTVNMTSATAETFVKGDPTASQFSGVSAGEVILSAYTTNDNTAATASALTLNGRDYLSFSDMEILAGTGGLGSSVDAFTQTSTNIKFTRCLFSSNSTTVWIQCAFNTTLNWLFDRCAFRTESVGFSAWMNRGSTGSNYSIGVDFKSCVFINTGAAWAIDISAQSTGTFYGAGSVNVFNCTFLGWQGVRIAQGGDTTNKVIVKNNIFATPSGALSASVSGEMDEDYNRLISGGRTNVTAGTNSKTQSWCVDLGLNWNQTLKKTIPWYPVAGEGIINAGTSTGAPTTDYYGNSFAGTPTIGAVETGTITTGGGLIVHPGMTGGMRG